MIIVKENEFSKSLDYFRSDKSFSKRIFITFEKQFIELKPRIDIKKIAWLRQQFELNDSDFKKIYYYFLDLTHNNKRYVKFYKATEDPKLEHTRALLRFTCYDVEIEDIIKSSAKNKKQILDIFKEVVDEYNKYYDIDEKVDDLYNRTMNGFSEWLSKLK